MEPQESPEMVSSIETHASLRYKSVQRPLRVIETPLAPHRSTIVACTDLYLKLVREAPTINLVQ
eukprot:4389676-Pyramimonas_sp.AAC.1